jgi:hypothetical protein
MTRHCTKCDAEVADTGGYCLLGHPLRGSMETASLADLKDEVDAAFAEAEEEVRDALAPLIEQVEAVAPKAAPEPVLAAVATAPASYVPTEPKAPAAPAAFHEPTRPTPPPPPQRPASRVETLWDGMDVVKPLDRNDPINDFAPPPRMDWGPKGRGKGRSLRRLRASQA